jgi:hypothetical protein
MKRDPVTIDRDTEIVQIQELVSAEIDEETVLMSVANGKYYGMDPIGSRIWALIAEPIKVSELCRVLLEEFEVEPAECEQDVLSFLNKLYGDSLIKAVDHAEAD